MPKKTKKLFEIFMEDRGLNINQAVKVIGINRSTAYKWLSGDHRATQTAQNLMDKLIVCDECFDAASKKLEEGKK